MEGMALEITEELIARQAPEAQAIIRVLLAQIQELQERLNQSPRNSSVPPSAQHPHAKPPRPKSQAKRPRGGQPGHLKQVRPLLPPEQCDDVIPLKPTACRRCGRELSGDDAAPLRHQVWELPEIKPQVIEYQRHRLACPCCGDTTCAALPSGVPEGQSGPRLVAFAGLLMAYFRQSKRRTALFLTTLLNQPCCPALTLKMQAQVTAALRPAYAELVQQLPTQPHLGIDESPTKEAAAKAWLWTFVAGLFTVFAVRGSRAATALTDLLTDAFTGVVICDRAKMYWGVGRLQWCWAHLKRDFQALVDSEDRVVKRLGHDLMRPTRELFRQWSRCRDGTLSRAELKRCLEPVRREVEGLLLRGLWSGHPRLEGMCRELYEHRQWLWTFLEEEVEPTNNASERALRHAVIWRKLSFGTQSASGSRFVETMLTVIETCRQQSRDVFAYVTAAVQAHVSHQPTPSLLPRV
jgi:transposase